MAIPDYQTLMRPVLVSAKETAKNTNEVVKDLIKIFKLTDEEVSEKQPSGRDTVLRNRTQWSFKYLYEAKLLDRPERGKYKTTDRGLKALKENSQRVDNSILEQFEEFNKWKYADVETEKEIPVKSKDQELQTPEEKLKSAHKDLINITKKDLLDRIHNCSPFFFESLVLKLIEEMGYGESQITKRSKDGGIDGVINQDPLGLDKIYIQAKRWKDPVDRPTVQKFAGAMSGFTSISKGIILTTSRFSPDSWDYKKNVKTASIEFIDGDKLTDLMIKWSVGLSVLEDHKRYEIDEDFFDKE